LSIKVNKLIHILLTIGLTFKVLTRFDRHYIYSILIYRAPDRRREMPNGIAMYEVDFKVKPDEKNPAMRCQFTFKDAENRTFIGFGRDWQGAKEDALKKRTGLVNAR
jgi:hypothetical protein